MPEINNNNYNIWSKQLSQAWGNQDLSKDHYDYRKYYNDQPIVAWLQLNKILAHNWNNGGTKIVYDGANVLPTLYVTKKSNGFNLKPNKNNNGYIYFDRKD